MSCFDFCEQGLGREDEHVDVAFVGSLRGRERGGVIGICSRRGGGVLREDG